MAAMRTGRRLLYGVLAALVLAAWALLQWRLARIVVSGNADDANTVLAGLDQWRGHVLLAGWTLPADSFITGDLPVAAVLGGLFGLGPWLLQAVPVVLAGIALLVALWLSVRGARTRLLAALPVAIAIGLPGVLATDFWLQSPMHVSTIAYCLGAFGVLNSGPSRWRWMGAGLLLVLAGVGDATAFAIGSVPVAVLGLRLLLSTDRRRRGLFLLLTAATAAGVTEALLALRSVIGAYSTAPAVPVVAAHQWLANAGHGVARFLQLTAAISGVPGAGGTAERAARLVMTAALLAATASGLVAVIWPQGRPRLRLSRAGDTAEKRAAEGSTPAASPLAEVTGGVGRRHELLALLGLSGLGSYGTFCVLSVSDAPQATTRYLLPLLVTSAVALGVLVGSVRPDRRWRMVAAGAAVLVGGGYLAMPLRTASGPLPTWPSATAVQWLAAHGLRHGVGTYWDASYLTLESGGAVVVRPVSATGGRLRPHRYFADARWFTDDRRPQFLVFEPGAPWGGVDLDSATATYGAPAQSVNLGPYTVLVWAPG